MRLGNYLWIFALLISATLSTNVFAVDYWWSVTYSGVSSTVKHSSPSAGCNAIKVSFGSSTWVQTMTPVKQTDILYRCLAKGQGQPDTFYGSVTRKGDSCPQGSEYNSETGECAAPENPCSDKAGQSTNWSRSGTAPDGEVTIVNGMIFPPTTGCVDSCAIETDRRDCTARTTGAYFCSGTGIFTGQQCSTSGTGSEFTPEDTFESPDPQTIKEDKPCVYSSNGNKQVCTSVKSEEVEGKVCGKRADGTEFCTTTPPKKTGVDISTEVSTETHSDGSTTTTKTDTATSTKCEGINNCTTKTATTTTVINKNPDGDTTSTDSKCQGSACGSSFNPDSDGDGLGDCTGDDCGAGGGGEGQDWYTPTGDTFGSVLTEFVGKVQQTPVASQTSSFLTFRATGSCPRWSVSVWVFDIDIDQLCNGDIPWNAIKAVILAAAGFFAFRIALL